MASAPAVIGISERTGEMTITWIGHDDRGVELTVVAIEKPDVFLVIHVMPTYDKEMLS
ncbi:MAG: hypothetical protein J2P16_00120 [Mycobacterium sp.]|nr:hypothetical protein [Mycobacterium sp.]